MAPTRPQHRPSTTARRTAPVAAIAAVAALLLLPALPVAAHDTNCVGGGQHLGRGDIVDGSVSPDDDRDVFRVTAYASEEINVFFNNQEGNDLRIQLRYPLFDNGQVDGCALWEDQLPLGVTTMNVDSATRSGPWFFIVECWGCDEASNYHLELEAFRDDADMELDAGDDPDSATTVVEGIHEAALMDTTPDWPSPPNDPQDWWKIQVPPLSKLTVRMEPECFPPDAPDRDFDLELRRQRGALGGGWEFVADSERGTCRTEEVTCASAVGNTVVVGVEHFDGPAGGYDLNVEISPEFEPVPPDCDDVL